MFMTCQLQRNVRQNACSLLFGLFIHAQWIGFSQSLDIETVTEIGEKRTGLQAPLTIPLVLSGNFGELRSDHFHSGLDFKTLGQEGFPVIASTGGVVSRVKVSPFGYGRAIYLNGPRGITTVYAHLQRFSPALETWVREQQYLEETFEWDGSPKRAFVFEQGDTIGWSGNSGSSGGPHLHFEVRETATQRPINPLLYDLDVADHIAPQMRAIWLIPEPGSLVDGRKYPVRYEQFGRRIRIAGKVRIAVDALDRLDGASNRCGVYRAEMWMDSSIVFAWQLDTLDFSLGRDMNAHAYYPEWKSSGEQVHRMHRLPGNRLPIYRSESRSAQLSWETCSNGLDSPTADEVRKVELAIRLWDVHGNLTSGSWYLEFESIADSVKNDSERLWSYDEAAFVGDASGSYIRAAPHTFYEDFSLELSRIQGETWIVGDSKYPAAKSFEVRLPLPDLVSEKGSGNLKWVAERVDEKGEVQDAYTGTIDETGFRFSTKMTGRYRLNYDAKGPVISPHRQHRTAADSALQVLGSELRFSISDDLSGIDRIHGTLDDQWLLFQWDPKKERIWYDTADGRHTQGRWHRLKIEVDDAAGNRSEWSGVVRFD